MAHRTGDERMKSVEYSADSIRLKIGCANFTEHNKMDIGLQASDHVLKGLPGELLETNAWHIISDLKLYSWSGFREWHAQFENWLCWNFVIFSIF